jgi:glycosyltransferase involved in cell wall biosynthesis
MKPTAKGGNAMRIDIHVHSKHSKRPSQWILKKLGCPESFTEPLQLYQIARSRGMSHVTITDHNSIDGAREIAHLPGTFLSEEITTYFPDNGCKIHVLALNITEAQHDEIQKVRENIYDLVPYLHAEKILSIAAHPLFAINGLLTVAHFEQLLLLFQHLELNGARSPRENACLRQVVENLSADTLARLSDQHGLAPLHAEPWKKYLWAGSDDHSGLNIARTYTEIAHAQDPAELDASAAAPVLEIQCQPASPLTMGHNFYSIAYQFYRSKFNLDRYTDKDALLRFMDRHLRSDADAHTGLFARIYLLWQHRKEKRAEAPVTDSLLALLRYETTQLMHDDPLLFQSGDPTEKGDARERKWHEFVNRASKRVMRHFGDNLFDNLSGANVFNIFSTIGSAGGLYTLLAPYFVAYAQFSKDRALSETLRRQFAPPASMADTEDFRLAHFTDTFYEVNGVALTLQQQVAAALKNHKAYTLVTCREEVTADLMPGVCNFKPIGTYALPEYPEQKIFYPPLLDMLAYCYDHMIDHIHTATPGPMGLAALAIARILKLPISGTYHTAIPQYARILTGDATIAELAWKYVIWYYDQLDVIYAPSRSTRDELAAKGIDPAKIRIYPRGIDVERFHPAKRNGIFQKQFPLGDGVKLLYVGRVSREKNLHLLTPVFRQLLQSGRKIQLVVVGDGPYLSEMQEQMRGLPCCFTGYLEGEQLAAVYASSDIFVFPSTTDTFGNVVLEAQASGLPVIVSDRGGPMENMLPGTTGLVCSADDTQSLLQALEVLICDNHKRAAMGRAARSYTQTRSFENAFLDTWRLFQTEPEASDMLRAAG